MKHHALTLCLLSAFSAAAAGALAAEPPPEAAPTPEGSPAPVPEGSAPPMPEGPSVAPTPPPPTVVRAPRPTTQSSVALGLPPARARDTFDDAGVPDDGSLGTHQNHFWVTLGVRTTLVKTSGFDVFAGDDALTQASIAFGRVLFSDGPWSFASALGWDVGGRSSNVRGAATSLDVHRFTLNPEVRYHLFHRFYAYGRVGAGGALVSSSLEDPIVGRERSRAPLCFTLDASAGLAFEVLGHKSGLSRTARGWLALDGGYVFTTPTQLVYSNDSSSPARSAPIGLGDLALSGPSARLSAAISF